MSLLPGIVGGAVGFVGALLLSVIARWREDERSRSKLRSALLILSAEMKHREGILLNKYADVDLSNNPNMGDIVKQVNGPKSGSAFNYAAELRPYCTAFEALKSRLYSLNPEISVQLWRHYATIEERLLAHENNLDPMSGDSDKAIEIRDGLREDTKKLIQDLQQEIKRKDSRAFLKWLPLWICGKA